MCHNQNWDPKPHRKKINMSDLSSKTRKSRKGWDSREIVFATKTLFPRRRQFSLLSGMGNLPICRTWEVTKLRSWFEGTSELIDAFGVLFSEMTPLNGRAGLPRTDTTSRQWHNTGQWENWTVRCQSRWPMQWNCNWKRFTPYLHCLVGRSFYVDWPCWTQQPSASATDNFTKGTSKNKHFWRVLEFGTQIILFNDRLFA